MGIINNANPLPAPHVFWVSWFDRIIYRLFYWRWNNKFKQSYYMRAVLTLHLENYQAIYNEYLNDSRG